MVGVWAVRSTASVSMARPSAVSASRSATARPEVMFDVDVASSHPFRAFPVGGRHGHLLAVDNTLLDNSLLEH